MNLKLNDEILINSYTDKNKSCKTERVLNEKRFYSHELLPSEYKFTTIRELNKKRKHDLRIVFENLYNNENTSRNYKFSFLNLSTYNPSTNITSYIQLNKSNNSSNIINQNESKTISTSPSRMQKLPQILDNTGKKFIKKQNYGKLLLFNDNIREERYQKYFNHILSDEYYFYNEKKGIKKHQYDVTMYGRNITESYFNSFYDSFNKYYRKIENATELEKNENEKLKLKENLLKTEINRLKQRKIKLLDKFFVYFSMKKFLLHVKNKTLDSNKFVLDDLRQYLKDEERKNLILNDYLEQRIRKNTFKKTGKKLNNAKKFLKFGSIKPNDKSNLNSSENSLKKRTTPSKSIVQPTIQFNNKFIYYPLDNKPIFKNVEEFENIFTLLNDELAMYLTKYNKLKKSMTPLIIEKKQIETQIKIEKEEEEKLIGEELKQYERKIRILKERNEELINQKRNVIKECEISYKEISLERNINEKVQDIFNYINKNYKKFDVNKKFEIKNNNPSLIRLEVIEKVINDLLIEKIILFNQYPKEYQNLFVELNLKEKLENIAKRKKLEFEKRIQLIQKIVSNRNKVYIIPTHKVFDKYDLSKLKKRENKNNISN